MTMSIKQLVTTEYMRCSMAASVIMLASSVFTVIPNSVPAAHLASGEEAKSLPTPYPIRLAVNPNTNMVYVANNNSISVLNGSTNEVVSNIILANRVAVFNGYLSDIAVNPNTNTVYVAKFYFYSVGNGYGAAAQQILALDGSTNKVIANITAGNFDAELRIAINSVTNMVYAVSWIGGLPCVPCPTCGICAAYSTMLSINGSTNKVASVQIGTNPSHLAVNPVTNRVYATLERSLSVIDGSTNKVLAHGVSDICPVKENPLGCFINGVAVNPTTDKVYVISTRGNPPGYLGPPPSAVTGVVYVIDGSTYRTVANLTVPYPTGIAINSNTNKVYVANPYRYEVTIIDGFTDTIVDKISLENLPWAIAVNPKTNTVYVPNQLSVLTAIDGATNKVIPEFPVTIVVAAVAIGATMIIMRTKLQR